MNVDDNTNVDINDDLNAFEDEFFGRTKAEPVEEAPEADEPEDEVEEEADEDVSGEVETPATDEDDDADEADEEEDEKPEPQQKKGKKNFQERINELTAKAREAERERDAVLDRLAKLEAASKKEEVKEEPAKAAVTFEEGAPQPDDLDEDGNELYPLGEFDPEFIRDLTRYTIQKEAAAAKAEAEERLRQEKIAEAKAELEVAWVAKLDETEKELPDLREKIESLTSTFGNLDANYGEYLATTIMSCESGPAILYYLAQNVGEAQKIVASGPAAATLAIGRLEAQLSGQVTKGAEKRNKTKETNAPPPPPKARGTGVAKTVAADTDDLDAFESVFFQSPKRR